MKKQTIENVKSVITVLKANQGIATPAEIVTATGLNVHQVNALQAVWANGQGGALTSPALWERKEMGGNTFLVITDDGAKWEAPKSAAPKAKAPTVPVEEARKRLLESLTGVKGSVITGDVVTEDEEIHA